MDEKVYDEALEKKTESKVYDEALEKKAESKTSIKPIKSKKERASEIWLVVDRTRSMEASLKALTGTLQQTLALMKLLGLDGKVGLMVFADYGKSLKKNAKKIEFQENGGVIICKAKSSFKEKRKFIKDYAYPTGAQSPLEAHRTAMNELFVNLKKRAIILHFTDAGPHIQYKTNGKRHRTKDARAETKNLSKKGMETNWWKLCADLRKKHRMITLLMNSDATFLKLRRVYALLGDVVNVGKTEDSDVVTQASMSILLRLFGVRSQHSMTFHKIDKEKYKPIEFKSGDESLVGNVKKLFPLTNDTNLHAELPLRMRSLVRERPPEIILDVFKRLLTNENVMSLTTNDVFGKFWRRIHGQIKAIPSENKEIKQGKYDDEIEGLSKAFSKCQKALDPERRKRFDEWLKDSYDNTDFIRRLQLKYAKESKVFLKLPTVSDITYREILEVIRGGANFKKIMEFISMIETTTRQQTLPNDHYNAGDFVPCNMPVSKILQMLGHLLSPGMYFSKRGAMIIAVFALRNAYLKDKAMDFLLTNKGKWLDLSYNEEKNAPNYPMNWSVGFQRILKMLDEKYLTEDEIRFRDKFLQISSIRSNLNSTIECTFGAAYLDRLRAGADYKIQCATCCRKRSFSICTRLGVCGHCKASNSKEAKKRMERKDGKANWAICNRCRSNYTVTDTEKLVESGMKTKCHFCRHNRKCPIVTCVRCKLKYAGVEKIAFQAMKEKMEAKSTKLSVKETLFQHLQTNEFICPKCVVGDGTVSEAVNLKALMQENKEFCTALPVGPYDIVTSRQIKLSGIIKRSFVRAKNAFDLCGSEKLTWKGLDLLNPLKVKGEVFRTLLHGSGVGTCTLCFDDVPLHKIHPLCGNCNYRACVDCIRRWYGRVVIGDEVTEAILRCPCCKRHPKFSVYKLASKDISVIKNRTTYEWEPTYHHAICTHCKNITPVIARACFVEGPKIENWRCRDCHPLEIKRREEMKKFNDSQKFLQKAPDAHYRECPNCRLKIEKIYGCDHITCTCGQHFCYRCGKGFKNASDTYLHLNTYC